MNKDTAVCLVCDTRFNPYACFAAASVSAQLKNSDLDIFIFTEGLSEHEAEFIRQFRNVQPVIIEGLSPPFIESPGNIGLSKATYYVIYLDRLLPGHFKKIIYLDCDVFISGSIMDLQKLDLEGRCLAAVRGLGMAGVKSSDGKSRLRSYWDERGIAGDPVLNSGVLVIDRQQWREMNMEQRLIKAIIDNPGIGDEEAFNIVLQHNWLELSPKWNFFAFEMELGLESFIQPVINHYMATPKPWNSLFWNHDQVHRSRYRSFFRNSPWPDAARVRVHPSRLRNSVKKKVNYLGMKLPLVRHLAPFDGVREHKSWLRDTIIDLYNESVDAERFADHRQGLTKLARIE